MQVPAMPHQIGKGAWLSLLEDQLNGDDERARQAHDRLSAGDPLTDATFLDEHALDDDPSWPTARRRRHHLARDWFGRGLSGSHPETFEAAIERQLPRQARAGFRDAVVASRQEIWPRERDRILHLAHRAIDAGLDRPFPTTGFWQGYHGDVEEVVRVTLRCALEVSFGVARLGQRPGPGHGRLPIELLWLCPMRWVEGWVTWRYDPGSGLGQVTVLLATPGTGQPLLERPLDGDGAVEPAGPLARASAEGERPAQLPRTPPPDPVATRSPRGMWVVGHDDQVPLPLVPGCGAGTAGREPATSYVGAGPVRVVSPSEGSGGTHPDGRVLGGGPSGPACDAG